MEKMISLKFKSSFAKQKVKIVNLKSRGGSTIVLPLNDHTKREPLPDSKQVLKVTEKEANDLMRQWPKNFTVIKKAAKPVEEEKRKESEE